MSRVYSLAAKLRRGGFTILELLVSISVIGILAGMTLGRTGHAKENAYVSTMKNDLHNYALTQARRNLLDLPYAVDPTGIPADYVYSQNTHTVLSVADATKWWLVVGHSGTAQTCRVGGGDVTSEDRVIVCAPGTMDVPPTPTFGASETDATSGDSVTFNASGSLWGGVTGTYVWDFGDGSTGSGMTVTHPFDTPGTYRVGVTVTDGDGESRTTYKTITVTAYAPPPPAPPAPNQLPTASFVISNMTPAPGDALTFDGSASNDPDGTLASYAWVFGDGMTGTGVSTVHSYASSGSYSPRLTVTDDRGGTGTASKNLTVTAPNSPPVAAFSVTSPAATGTDIAIVNSSSDPDVGQVLAYAWDFGDGTTSTSAMPGKSYSTPGSRTVLLTVTDPSGLTSTASQSIVVTNRAPSVPSVSCTPASLQSGTNSTCTASGAVDPDGGTVAYQWSTTNLVSSNGSTATYTRASAGTVSVSVSATDGQGGTSAPGTKTITFVTPPPSAPTISCTSTTISTGDVVPCQAVEAGDPNGTMAYQWSSDGFAGGAGTVAQYGWMTAGVKTVSVVVSDGQGGQSPMVSQTITVLNRPPVASFTIDTTSNITNKAFQFTSNASDPDGGTVTYLWDFGDGSTSANQSPAHSYIAHGSYSITLTVTDGQGGSFTTAPQTVSVVNQPPVATFTTDASLDSVVYSTRGTFSCPSGCTVNGDSVTVGATTIVYTGNSVDPMWPIPSTAGYGNFQSYGGNSTGDDFSNVSFTLQIVQTYPTNDVTSFTGKLSGTLYATGSTVAWNLPVSTMDGVIGSANYYLSDNGHGIQIFAPTMGADWFSGTLYADTHVIGAAFTFTPAATDPDGGTLAYSWNFGDGTSSTSASPTHAYSTAGNYTVTLTVTDGQGGTVTTTRTLTVVPPANQPPTASYTVSATTKPTGSNFVFTSTSSDPDGGTLAYAWDFGDGATSTAANPTHAYSTPGSYAVTLTVTDGQGGSATATPKTLTATNRVPTVSFVTDVTVSSAQFTTRGSFSCASGCTVNGDSVTVGATTLVFTGSSNHIGLWSYTGYGQFTTYGGNPAGGAYDDFSGVTFTLTFTQTLPAAGTTTISGRMSGKIRSDYSDVQWVPPTRISSIGNVGYSTDNGFIVSPGSWASLGGTVYGNTKPTGTAFTFTPTASDPDGGILSYSWNFGDGTTSALMSPTHAYASPGTYNVILTVTDGQGGSKAVTNGVLITNQAPTASFVTNGTLPTVQYTTMTTFSCPAGCTTSLNHVTVGSTTITFGGAAGDVSLPTGTINYDSFVSSGGSAYPAANASFDGVTATVTLTQGGQTGTMTGLIHGSVWTDKSTAYWVPTSNSILIGSVLYTVNLQNVGGGVMGIPIPAAGAGPQVVAGNIVSDAFARGVNVSFTSTAVDPDGGSLSYSWNFGDGTTSSAASPTHSYASAGNYTVTLIVGDGQGGSALATRTVTVIGNRIPSGGQISCAPVTAPTNTNITCSVSGWTDPDGDVISTSLEGYDAAFNDLGQGPLGTFQLTTPQVAYVQAVANDNQGSGWVRSGSLVRLQGTNRSPTASFTVSPKTNSPTGTLLTLAATASDPDGGTLTYAWDFGDGATGGNSATITHTYATAGTYTATLTVTDGQGGSTTVTQSITPANRAPTASFTVDAASKATGAAFVLTSTSNDPDGTIASYSWTFSDGGTSTIANPTHAFSTPGNYTITLVVTDNSGATGLSGQNVTATNRAPSTPTVTCSPATVAAGAQTTCTASGSVDPDGGTVNYAFTPGGFVSQSGASAIYSWSTPGSYGAGASAYDNQGGSSPVGSVGVTVTAAANQPPTASYTVDASSKATGAGFVFTSVASDPDGGTISYLWDFGDGATSTSANPTHAYVATGSYTTSLTVTDGQGGSYTTATQTLTATNQPPTASYTVESTEPTNTYFWFKATASDPDGGTISYLWDFGDGNTSTDQNPAYAYVAAGTYHPTLTVTDGQGGTFTTAAQTVTVTNQPPTASYTVESTEPTNTYFWFTATASDPDGGTISYLWNFGDGNTSTAQNPAYAYATPGTYNPTLTVTDGQGGTFTTAAQTVTVTNRPPTASFTKDASTHPTGTNFTFTSTASDPDGGTIAYLWAFGDGNTSTAKNPTHAYATPGGRSVTLTVTDGQGGTFTTAAQTLTATNRSPTVTFTTDATTHPTGTNFTFTTTASDPDGGTLVYAWTFGDGGTSTLKSPTHAYATPGVFSAKVVVTDGQGGSTTSATKSLTATNRAPTVTFTTDATTHPTGTNFTFTTTASDPDGGTLAYAWAFGDGGTSTLKSPTHAYATPGTFIAKVVVTDGQGGSTTSATKSLTATNRAPSTPTVTCSPATIASGAQTTCTASGSVDPDGGTVNYAFTPDGLVSQTGAAAIYSWTTTGAHSGGSSAYDNQGGSSPVAYGNVTVTSPNQPPTATFGVDKTYKTIGTSYIFTSTASDPDGGTISYGWDFGDGTTSTLANPIHAYTGAGSYSVVLTVNDGQGGSYATPAQTVVVSAPLVNQELLEVQTGKCLDVLHQDQTPGDSVTIWTCSGQPNERFSMPTVGVTGTLNVYSLCVGVNSSTGVETETCNDATSQMWTRTAANELVNEASGKCMDVYGKWIPDGTWVDVYDCNGGTNQQWTNTSNQLPSATFTVGPKSAEPTGTNFTFTSTSSDPDPYGGNMTYLWDFGDGSTSTVATATHSYATPGDYNVTLTVNDGQGGVVTSAPQTVTASNRAPSALFTYSTTGNTVTFDASGSSDPDGIISSYSWTYGDTGTGTGVNPSHAYAGSGSYPVQLVVTDNSGATGQMTVSVTISAGSPPVASFAVDSTPLGMDYDATSVFSCTSGCSLDALKDTVTVGGTAIGMQKLWTVGAGYPLPNPTWVTSAYIDGTASPGGDSFNNVSLQVTLHTTWPDTETVVFSGPLSGTIMPSSTSTDLKWTPTLVTQGVGPVHFTPNLMTFRWNGWLYQATFRAAYTQSIHEVGVAYNFTSAATDPTGGTLSYFWDFGDGSTSTLANPQHAYSAIGDYTTTLKATSSNGGSTTVSRVVSVWDIPVEAYITADASSKAVGVPFAFTAGNEGGPGDGNLTYSWDFGDGSTSTLQNPTHAYSAKGNYTVVLTVRDGHGKVSVSDGPGGWLTVN